MNKVSLKPKNFAQVQQVKAELVIVAMLMGLEFSNTQAFVLNGTTLIPSFKALGEGEQFLRPLYSGECVFPDDSISENGLKVNPEQVVTVKKVFKVDWHHKVAFFDAELLELGIVDGSFIKMTKVKVKSGISRLSTF